MSAGNYDEALKRVLVHEGSYSNDAADPGGPTNFGITIYDYRKYINPAGTAADVRSMTVEQAKKIYRAHYADPIRFDDLPSGVDYAVLDYSINSGIGRGAKVLQRIVGVGVDGEIGDDTISAARARDPKVLVGAICDERLAFLHGLSTWGTFGKGWGRRVAEVRAAALAMAGKSQGVTPSPQPIVLPNRPPWLARMDAILGLYEFPRGADNPAILAMAKACGGQIAATYKHDAIPWCALALNYVLLTSGFPSTDSLLALSFRSYGRRLSGPAVGAIASQSRSGGGHVYLVVGRTSDGRIVARGGNQSDMVCDTTFPADDASRTYVWPVNYPVPTAIGFSNLPIVTPAPKAHKDVVLPPPSVWTPGKGIVPVPKLGEKVIVGTGGGGTAAAVTWWDWVAAHPFETTMLAAGGAMIVGAGVYAVRSHYKAKQDAPMPGLVPVAV